MKKKIIILSFLMASFCLGINAASKKRTRCTFDQGWTFKLCANHAEASKVLHTLGITNPNLSSPTSAAKKTKLTDDTEPEQAQVTASEITSSNTSSLLSDKTTGKAFRNVTIPHDWSIELPFDPKMGGSAGYLAGGQGIYAKDFTLPTEYQKKLSQNEKISIHFDGVYHRATIWLNGHRLGHHMYGYTSFSFDITPYINKVGKNRLVVHVDREEQSRWYTGSGIYRHVWLQMNNPVHVKENGIFVTAKTDGTVKVETEVEGDKGCRISHVVLDKNGKKIAAASSEKSSLGNPSASPTSSSTQLFVKNPQLWSTDSPNLYTLVTQVKDSKGKLVDEVVTPFGFRDIRFDANTGSI